MTRRDKGKKKISILAIILIIIFLPILTVNIILIIKSYINPEEVPDLFGFKPFIVLSGSMEKEIMIDDLIIVKEYDTKTTKVGDIIAFKIDDTVITHRIYAIEESNGIIYYTTKGDNNNIEDREQITEDNIEGKYLFRIPKIGALAMFMQTTLGSILFISIPFVIFIIYDLIKRRQEKKQQEEEQNKLKEELKRVKLENEKEKILK